MQEQLTMNRPKGHHLTLKERGNVAIYFNHDGYSHCRIVGLIAGVYMAVAKCGGNGN
ncbi:hypothetical protein ACFP1C_10120 [Levilactobacillus fujinensis]|uniref:Uncharacterized protein n=2 Tax=Levilactobacillus fujinensis TaxID=2486024 RepID=A0ABW1TJB4_9LACO